MKLVNFDKWLITMIKNSVVPYKPKTAAKIIAPNLNALNASPKLYCGTVKEVIVVIETIMTIRELTILA